MGRETHKGPRGDSRTRPLWKGDWRSLTKPACQRLSRAHSPVCGDAQLGSRHHRGRGRSHSRAAAVAAPAPAPPFFLPVRLRSLQRRRGCSAPTGGGTNHFSHCGERKGTRLFSSLSSILPRVRRSLSSRGFPHFSTRGGCSRGVCLRAGLWPSPGRPS